ncbi:unnamed protein product [Rotaria sordida]|uniref:Uncharacterized protein n=2 Tax=Rotaria sordida TaxID=392033 RepID=A0A815R3H1_9BILA|nr:unnamed protein product [Rotaria sordida]CAF1045079.1 unnamed protein product [Rotaria sordida]CAF1212463.1 unnamed protein product [Rotaria sordida]CAF1449144.1 unnamed protein product [Rotaria sordida]CAF1471622.1 unnamed protein product [Rotaria sordida]
MVQLSILLFGLLIVGNWAVPATDELQEIYVDACQLSCGLVNNNHEADGCREKFCPNYVNYLLTGFTIPDSPPSLASTNQKEVEKFCATWMLHLLEEFGWQRRIHLNLKDCTCAAGTDCLVK